MAQKARTKMSDLNIGKLIEEDQKKDAIHIAVLPVVALEKLNPGQPIAINKHIVNGVEFYGASSIGKSLGIIDPFLKEPVNAGQKCWMFMYPNTITSLKHDWTHPDIEADSDQKALEAFAAKLGISYEQLVTLGKHSVEPDKKQKAKEWLEEFAKNVPFYDYSYDYSNGKHIGYRYEDVLDIGMNALTKKYVGVGDDNAQDYFNEHKEEFLRNVAIVLDAEYDEDSDPPYFSCAC